MRERVCRARRHQIERQGATNAELAGAQLARQCGLGAAERGLLERTAERLKLSARALHRTLRVARTIADLAGADAVSAPQLQEALAFRPLELER